MIVSDFLACPLAIHSTDFGIIEDVDIATTDPAAEIVSRHFHIQIRDFPDLEKIKMPVVTHNELATELYYQAMCEVYCGIMPVKKMGQTHIWFTPWDYLIRWWGVQEAMVDLVERPDLVHAAVERMVDAWMIELDQFVELNLLALDCNNTRIGSGGYGYTKSLPGPDFDPGHVKPHNMWGCSNAQIFSDVSPEMQWEFAVKHDLRWLERWGMVYYGCCEPLDRKIEVLRRIPNLRKISASYWNNTERLVDKVGGDYVLSHKPTPAIFARDHWDPEGARQELRTFLTKTRRPVPRGTDHEGYLHGALRAEKAVGMGEDRDAKWRKSSRADRDPCDDLNLVTNLISAERQTRHDPLLPPTPRFAAPFGRRCTGGHLR